MVIVCFLSSGGAEVWTQGLDHAEQVPYHELHPNQDLLLTFFLKDSGTFVSVSWWSKYELDLIPEPILDKEIRVVTTDQLV